MFCDLNGCLKKAFLVFFNKQILLGTSVTEGWFYLCQMIKCVIGQGRVFIMRHVEGKEDGEN